MKRGLMKRVVRRRWMGSLRRSAMDGLRRTKRHLAVTVVTMDGLRRGDRVGFGNVKCVLLRYTAVGDLCTLPGHH